MIDWSRIAELESEVGEEDFAEIAPLFLEELIDTVTGLPDRPGAAQREEDFHSLKGSALNLGFSELAALCAAAEAAPTGADPARIRTVAEDSVAALCERYPGLAG